MTGSRQATLAFVARLPETDIRRRGTLGRWSIKDALGHLLTCDEETIRRFRLIARGRADRIFWFRSLADADRFNARSVARTRRLSVPVILRRLTRVRADLVERFERLPATALRDRTHEYSVVDWLPAPGWSHEREHLDDVRAWWRVQRRPRVERRRGGRAR